MGQKMKYFFIAVFLVVVMAGPLSRQAFAATKKIGILLWSDESRYKESARAMLEQLKADGFSDLEVRQESAGANKATAMHLAQDFSAANMDVYVGLGTNGMAALLKEIKSAPIVFNVVYDPVTAGFVDSWQRSKNNVTGVSNFLPRADILERVKGIVPLKNLAVLYTPDQKNSESQLRDLQKVEKQCGVNVIPVPLSSSEEAVSIMPLLKGKVEAVFLTGSGYVGTAIGPIIGSAIKEKIVPVSHLPDYVDQGVFLSVGADMRELGQTAAAKVEAILKGALPTDIPVEGPKKIVIYLNLRTAKAIGFNVPDELRKEALKIVE